MILLAYQIWEVLNFEAWLGEVEADNPELALAQDGEVKEPLGNLQGGLD